VRVPVCVGDLVEPFNCVLRKLTRRKLQPAHSMALVCQWIHYRR
jgi:hypothetical protein